MSAHRKAKCACVVLLLLLCASLWAPVAGAKSGPPRTISVTGTFVTKVAPDVIDWDIGLTETDTDLAQAVRRSDEKMRAVLAIVREYQSKPQDVQTDLSIRRVHNRDKQGRVVSFKHFAVGRSIDLRMRDLSRFDEFFARMIERADLEVDFSFDSTSICDLRSDTRLGAMRAARDKARAMAQVVGARLGKALTIDEHPRQEANPWGYGAGGFMNNAIYVPSRGDTPDDAVSASGTLAIGTIDVRITVYVTFEIE